MEPNTPRDPGALHASNTWSASNRIITTGGTGTRDAQETAATCTTGGAFSTTGSLTVSGGAALFDAASGVSLELSSGLTVAGVSNLGAITGVTSLDLSSGFTASSGAFTNTVEAGAISGVSLELSSGLTVAGTADLGAISGVSLELSSGLTVAGTADLGAISGVSLELSSGLIMSGGNLTVSGGVGYFDAISGVTLGGTWEECKVDNQSGATYTIVDGNQGQIVANTFTSGPATQTFTLPEITSGRDGFGVGIMNKSDIDAVITVQPANSGESVAESGDGYGIELPDSCGTIVWLVADYSAQRWELQSAIGGRVYVEGLKVYERCNKLTLYYPGSSAETRTMDVSGRHLAEVFNDITLLGTSSVGLASWNFPGNDERVRYNDAADWDMGGTSGEDWTIHKRVKFDNSAGNVEFVMAQREDANNRWYVRRESGGEINFQFDSGGATKYELTSTTTPSSGTWYDIDICRVGEAIGIYVDGSQEDYDTIGDFDTFAGELYIGESGAGSLYFNGKVDEFCILNQNFFNASPNSGNTDTITVPDRYLGLVYSDRRAGA